MAFVYLSVNSTNLVYLDTGFRRYGFYFSPFLLCFLQFFIQPVFHPFPLNYKLITIKSPLSHLYITLKTNPFFSFNIPIIS